MYGYYMNTWSPVRELERLHREMDRLFNVHAAEAETYPAVNIWSSNDEVVVTAELPGVEPKDIDIAVSGNQLTLKGERKAAEMAQDVVCHRCERGMGSFMRTISLPFDVEADKVCATSKNGVLTIKLPRAEATKPRKISITAG